VRGTFLPIIPMQAIEGIAAIVMCGCEYQRFAMMLARFRG
jgi:hypothetical protein